MRNRLIAYALILCSALNGWAQGGPARTSSLQSTNILKIKRNKTIGKQVLFERREQISLGKNTRKAAAPGRDVSRAVDPDKVIDFDIVNFDIAGLDVTKKSFEYEKERLEILLTNKGVAKSNPGFVAVTINEVVVVKNKVTKESVVATATKNLIPLKPGESYLITFGFKEIGFKPLPPPSGGSYTYSSGWSIPTYEATPASTESYVSYTMTCEIFTFTPD
jgi:hypothetical protein